MVPRVRSGVSHRRSAVCSGPVLTYVSILNVVQEGSVPGPEQRYTRRVVFTRGSVDLALQAAYDEPAPCSNDLDLVQVLNHHCAPACARLEKKRQLRWHHGNCQKNGRHHSHDVFPKLRNRNFNELLIHDLRFEHELNHVSASHCSGTCASHGVLSRLSGAWLSGLGNAHAAS